MHTYINSQGLHVCISLLQVLQLCKYILLYTCSPAALVRLAETPLLADFSHLCYMYKKQHHSSISDFLKYHIESCWNTQSMDGLLMQVRRILFISESGSPCTS